MHSAAEELMSAGVFLVVVVVLAVGTLLPSANPTERGTAAPPPPLRLVDRL